MDLKLGEILLILLNLLTGAGLFALRNVLIEMRDLRNMLFRHIEACAARPVGG